MRKLMCLICLIFSPLVLADEIKCYTQNGIKIVDRHNVEVTYDIDEGMFVIKDEKNQTMTFASFDCVAKLSNPLD